MQTPHKVYQLTAAALDPTTNKHNSSPMVLPVPADQVAGLWAECLPHLNKVLVRADCPDSEETLLHRLQAGKAVLWVGYIRPGPISGVAISQVEESPKYRTMWLLYCAGDQVEVWGDSLLSGLEEWAKRLDCKYVEFRGRHGWMALMPQRDYKDVSRIFRKTL